MKEKLTVIFDFDGTLANSFDLIARIYNEHAHKFGAKQVDPADLPVLRKLGYTKAMKAAGIRWSVLPKLILFIRAEMKQHMNEVKPYPGIVEGLNKLQAEGVSIGVLTSNNAELVQEFFGANHFPVFDFVVSEKTVFGKDKALKRIMRRHDLRADRVAYVGDEPRDVAASNKARVTAIGVTWGFGGREGFERRPPAYQVDSTKELLDVIANLQKN